MCELRQNDRLYNAALLADNLLNTKCVYQDRTGFGTRVGPPQDYEPTLPVKSTHVLHQRCCLRLLRCSARPNRNSADFSGRQDPTVLVNDLNRHPWDSVSYGMISPFKSIA